MERHAGNAEGHAEGRKSCSLIHKRFERLHCLRESEHVRSFCFYFICFFSQIAFLSLPIIDRELVRYINFTTGCEQLGAIVLN